MQNSHLIIVRFLRATNTKPYRIKLTSTRYGCTKIIPFKSDNKTQDSIEYLIGLGFEITGKAWNEINGDSYLLTSTFKEF